MHLSESSKYIPLYVYGALQSFRFAILTMLAFIFELNIYLLQYLEKNDNFKAKCNSNGNMHSLYLWLSMHTAKFLPAVCFVYHNSYDSTTLRFSPFFLRPLLIFFFLLSYSPISCFCMSPNFVSCLAILILDEAIAHSINFTFIDHFSPL